MKLIKSIHPKNLLRSKKSKSVQQYSFNTGFSSSSSSSSSSDASFTAGKPRRPASPTSVLRENTQESSGDWSDGSVPGAVDVRFELVEAFKLIDHDGDGKITARELEGFLSRIGAAQPSEEELATMLAGIDRDGCISLEEFAAASAALGPEWRPEELRETFDVFDADHDGRITAEELHSVFVSIGDESCTLDDCRRMIESVDINGDGFVCFEDFTRMMVPHQERC